MAGGSSGAFDAISGQQQLPCCLGNKLLLGGFAAKGLVSSLLRMIHRRQIVVLCLIKKVEKKRGNRDLLNFKFRSTVGVQWTTWCLLNFKL